MYSIYAYIDPPNDPNVGKYGSLMECLGTRCTSSSLSVNQSHGSDRSGRSRFVDAAGYQDNGYQSCFFLGGSHDGIRLGTQRLTLSNVFLLGVFSGLHR